MAEPGKGRRIIWFVGTSSFHRKSLCDVIHSAFHDCDSFLIVDCSRRRISSADAQQVSNLYRRSSQIREDYRVLLPLTATQAKYINCDFCGKALSHNLLFSAYTMKTAHLELSASVIKTWLNKSAKAMYTEHREIFVVQYSQDRRFVFIDTSRLFTRRIRAVRTTALESLCIWKRFLRIRERFRRKPLLHLANQIKCLWNVFWSEGVQRESRGQLIPAF